MPPPSPATLAQRPPSGLGVVARLRAVAGALQRWLIDVEYRLRVWKPFTFGSGGARVFYPGCSLTAADPELVLEAFAWLKARDPNVDLWSDCCGMPLEKFSGPEAAARGRERTVRLINETGTKEIITACGNCSVQFGKLAVPGLRVTSLYGLLAEADWGPRVASKPMVVHHPCSARIDKDQQVHFRALATRLGLKVTNADDPKHPLACCLVKTPGAMAKRQALADQTLVTYCGHCTMAFQRDIPTRHVLQETFGAPGERWKHRGKLGTFLQYFRLARLAGKKPSS